MADWSIDPGFCEAPTHVTTGDECAHAMRSENCGRTDCPDCGREASVNLRAAALLGIGGIVALADEIIRVEAATEGCPVEIADLSKLRRVVIILLSHEYTRWLSMAWAEGIIDARERNSWLVSDAYFDDDGERTAYMVGRLLVELHMVNEHLTKLEAQAVADAQEVR